MEIRKISRDDYAECTKVISKSFMTVANDLNLTRENAPTNPAFIDEKHLYTMAEKNIIMLGAFIDSRCIGFVAVEKANNGVYYLERLAILPEERHKGYGRQLVNYIVQFVEEHGGTKISIGIINENKVLKNWYQTFDFVEVNVKRFEHLPFGVCFMEKEINLWRFKMIDKSTGNIMIAKGIRITKDTKVDDFFKKPLVGYVHKTTLDRKKANKLINSVNLINIEYQGAEFDVSIEFDAKGYVFGCIIRNDEVKKLYKVDEWNKEVEKRILESHDRLLKIDLDIDETQKYFRTWGEVNSVFDIRNLRVAIEIEYNWHLRD